MMEILIPLRNPTDALIRTIDSLLQQERRDFSILLSDNHSISGQFFIEESVRKLSKAGLDAQLVRPPMELKKAEHWNWTHFQSQAAWLKPLFAGDWLEPEYMTIVLSEIEKHPSCSYIYCGYPHLQGKLVKPASPEMGAPETNKKIPVAAASRFFSPIKMQKKVLHCGIEFGPPSVAAYRREAFLAMGGYRTTLPVYADSLLFCTLATRFGGAEISPCLVNFDPQEAPLFMASRKKQVAAFREKVIFLVALIYHAFTESRPLSQGQILRRMALEIRQRLRAKLNLSTP